MDHTLLGMLGLLACLVFTYVVAGLP